MDNGLLSVFTERDFDEEITGGDYGLEDIISLSYVMNKSTGERFARAVLEDGTTLIKPAFTKGEERCNSGACGRSRAYAGDDSGNDGHIPVYGFKCIEKQLKP